MAPPKDIARSYPKRGLTADVGFRSEPAFVGDGSVEYAGTNSLQFDGDHTFVNGFSVAGWYWVDGTQSFNYAGFAGNTIAWGFPASGTYLVFYQKATSTAHQTVGGTLTPKQWNHIAFTLSQDGLTVKCYLNGVELTITQPSVAIVLPSLTTIGEAGIAAFQNSAPGAGVVLPYGGQMANQIWYDGVLTQDEVRQLMRAPNYAVASTIVTPQFYFELFNGITDSTGNATTVEDRGTTTTVYGVKRPQLPRGLDLARGAAQARVYTGRAVDFDGSADYLDIGRKDFGTGDFSISLWFYDQVSSGGNRSLYSKGTYNTVGGLLIYNVYGATGPGEYLMLRNDHQASGGLYDDRLIITTEPTPNAWHHIAVTRTGGTVKGYFDGKLVNTSTNFNPAWDINVTQNSFIGARDPSSPGSFWDGFISSVKVWDTVLTDAQVAEQFHNPEQVLPTGTSASNLDRYYPLSDYNDTGGTGGRWFQDMGADGEPAEDQGSALMAFAQPVPCPQLGLQQSATRLLFPGGTTTHNAVATTAALGTNASVSCWFQCNNPSPVGIVWSVGLSGTNHWYIYIQSGNMIIGPGNITIGSVTEGAWTHLVVTTDSGSPPYKAYVNGAEVSLTGTDTARSLTSGSFEIGNQDVASSPFVFTGILNDVACWNTELSLSDAQSLYNSGVMGMDVSTVQSSNLKGWWKCDDLTSFKDYSGNGANATVTNTFNAASFPENASGSTIVGDFSLKRKGVSVLNPTTTPNVSLVQSAIISNDGSLSPDPSKGGYSFSTFIRLQQASGTTWYPTVFGATNYNTASQRFVLIFNASIASLRMTMSDGSTPRDYYWPSGLSNPEEWHQLAFTIDYTTSPNTTFKLYLDGALVSTQATHVHSAFDPGDILVGSYTYSNGNFPGAIACFKMYQTKLSDDEMEQVYRSDLRLIKGLANE